VPPAVARAPNSYCVSVNQRRQPQHPQQQLRQQQLTPRQREKRVAKRVSGCQFRAAPAEPKKKKWWKFLRGSSLAFQIYWDSCLQKEIGCAIQENRNLQLNITYVFKVRGFLYRKKGSITNHKSYKQILTQEFNYWCWQFNTKYLKFNNKYLKLSNKTVIRIQLLKSNLTFLLNSVVKSFLIAYF